MNHDQPTYKKQPLAWTRESKPIPGYVDPKDAETRGKQLLKNLTNIDDVREVKREK